MQFKFEIQCTLLRAVHSRGGGGGGELPPSGKLNVFSEFAGLFLFAYRRPL